MTELMKPSVSFVLPAFNEGQNIEKSLRRLDSTFKRGAFFHEVVVVDDASTDGTCNEIEQFFPFVSLVKNSKQQLLAQSRNIGLQKCNGDLIFLIDDDNVVAEDTIIQLVNVMKRIPILGVAGPLMYYFEAPSRARILYLRGENLVS